MKGLLWFSLLWSASAAPAVVWKSSRELSSVVHSSDDVNAADLFADVMNVPDEPALPAVIFLLGRNADGSESLSTMASSGALPNVAAKYEQADSIHHHCSGLESPAVATRSMPGALQVTLSEFSSKLAMVGAPVQEMEISAEGSSVPIAKSVSASNKRTKALSKASVLVVDVPASTEAATIDAAVLSAIEHSEVGNVVLASVRSVEEVKYERDLQQRRKLSSMQKAGRRMLVSQQSRRLDEAQGDDADNNGDDDLTGIYYVSMTPNILAGLLFFLLFSVTTMIGVTCMGMISGQDVYVNKMPVIGREA